NDTATTEIYTLSLHDALPISQRFDLIGGPACQAQSLQPARDFRFDTASGTQLAVELQQCLDGHLLVKAALFGKISDEVRAGLRPAISEKTDLPAIGMEDVDDHPHRGGFARPVRPDESVDRSLWHREREVVNRGHTAEGQIGRASCRE